MHIDKNVWAVILSVIIHAILLMLGMIIINYLGYDCVNTDYARAVFQKVGTRLNIVDEVETILMWLWGCGIAISLIISLLWLFATNTVKPATPKMARSMRGAWYLCLLLLIFGLVALCVYQLFFSSDGRLDETFMTFGKISLGVMISIVTSMFVCTVCAYTFGTCYGVKRAMQPSVPFLIIPIFH